MQYGVTIVMGQYLDNLNPSKLKQFAYILIAIQTIRVIVTFKQYHL
jgi:hypothetical protein